MHTKRIPLRPGWLDAFRSIAVEIPELLQHQEGTVLTRSKMAILANPASQEAKVGLQVQGQPLHLSKTLSKYFKRAGDVAQG